MFRKRRIKIEDILKKLDEDYEKFDSCKNLNVETSNNFFSKIFDYVNLCCTEGQKRTQDCITIWNKWVQDDSDEIDADSVVAHTEAILQANALAFTKIMLLQTCVESDKVLDSEKLQKVKNIILEYIDIESKCLNYYNARYYLNRHVEMVNDVFDDNAKSVRKLFIFNEDSQVDISRNESQQKLDLYLTAFNMHEQLIDLNQDFVQRYADMQNLFDDDCSFTRKVISYNMFVAQKINKIDEYVIDNFGQIFNEKPALESLDAEQLRMTCDIFSDVVKLNNLVSDRLEIACIADLYGCDSSDFGAQRTTMLEYIKKEADIVEKYFKRGGEYAKGEELFLNQLCNPNFVNLYDWKVIEHRK